MDKYTLLKLWFDNEDSAEWNVDADTEAARLNEKLDGYERMNNPYKVVECELK